MTCTVLLLPPGSLDPSLVAPHVPNLTLQIDPKLLALESLVRQCNNQQPVTLDLLPEPEAETEVEGMVEMEDEGIDPALREIVDHLAREQVGSLCLCDESKAESVQQEHAFQPLHLRQPLPMLPQQDRDRDALQQSLQTTLDDLAQVSFDYTPYFPEPEPEPGSSHQGQDSSTNPLKRPRGRPKGSKNKPRPIPIPDDPPPEPIETDRVEKKRRGRPHKVCSVPEYSHTRADIRPDQNTGGSGRVR
jgi:hypothetical protein